MSLTALSAAGSRERFGGKACHLAADLLAGLPVPGGFALDTETAAQVAGGTLSLVEPLSRAGLPGPFAVRSSAVDEDGAGASFAGQHATVLGVAIEEIDGAVREVHASAHSESALAYRRRLGLSDEPRMAVVVQRLVAARAAAVVFTRDPVSEAREILIEAAWGLGEVVVAGLVTPDRYRLGYDGKVLERTAGEKDVEVVHSGRGSVERPVVGPRVHALCLDDRDLSAVVELVARVRAMHDPGEDHDMEVAFDEEGLHLLQRRRITR